MTLLRRKVPSYQKSGHYHWKLAVLILAAFLIIQPRKSHEVSNETLDLFKVEPSGIDTSRNPGNASHYGDDISLSSVVSIGQHPKELSWPKSQRFHDGSSQISKMVLMHTDATKETSIPLSEPIPPGALKAVIETDVPTLYGLPITSANHTHEFNFYLDRATEFNEYFCVSWDVNADEWWTHHPEWEAGKENDTHYCFQEIKDEDRRSLYRKIYRQNFQGNCSNVYTKRMWNSGWNADFSNVIDGLKHAVKSKTPVQVVEKPWHYAHPARKPTPDNKNTPPACPRKNMFCYFLPISNCPGDKLGAGDGIIERPSKASVAEYYYDFAQRRQAWLRKRIHDYARQHNFKTPCTAIHVRRGDVVLHGGNHKRRYHPIAEYVNATPKIHPNVYLLTDDKNAIAEAQAEFPKLNWMYVERPRYKASEGGWEKHIPSNDPVFEVTALLAELYLARMCDSFIHGSSGFSKRIYREMLKSGRQNIRTINIDSYLPKSAVFNKKHANTVNLSHKYDAEVLSAGNNVK